MNLKDKKLPLIAGGAAVIVILLLLIFMPSKKESEGPEVISKRVKIEVPVDGAATTDSTTDGAGSVEVQQTAQAPVQTAAPAVQAPAPAPVLDVKPAPVQPKAQAKAEPKATVAKEPTPKQSAPRRTIESDEAPVEKVKKEAAKPKAEKAVKKAEEKTKKVADVSKRILAAEKAWVINMASFPSLAEAQNLAGRLKKFGYKAYVVKFTKDSVEWHRVRVGFFASREEATKAGNTMKTKFNLDQPWVTKPDKAEVRAHM